MPGWRLGTSELPVPQAPVTLSFPLINGLRDQEVKCHPEPKFFFVESAQANPIRNGQREKMSSAVFMAFKNEVPPTCLILN